MVGLFGHSLYSKDDSINGIKVVVDAEKTIHVRKKEDFSNAPGGSVSGGKITLVENFTYFIDADFSIGTNSFVIPDSATSNINFVNNGFNDKDICCDGAGELFEDNGIGLFNVFRVNFTNTDELRTFANPTASANPLSQFALLSCLITGFLSIGTWDIRAFISECAFVNNINGITFNKGMLIEKGQFLNTSDLGTTFFTYAATFTGTSKIVDIVLTTFPGETMFDISSSILNTILNRIIGNTLNQGTGTIFDAGGLDQTSPGVLSRDNDGLADSRTIGSVILVGGTATTVIDTQNVFVDLDLDASATIGAINERFGTPDATTGAIEHLAIQDFSGDVGGSIDVSTPSNKIYNLILTDGNNVQIPGTRAIEFSAFPISGSVPIPKTALTIPGIASAATVAERTTKVRVTSTNSTDDVDITGFSLTFTRAG